jgi:ubiquitin-protein ligase E3 C
MLFLQWFGKQEVCLDDLRSLDPVLHQALTRLRHDTGDLAHLSVYFTIAIEGILLLHAPFGGLIRSHPECGITKTVDLIPNGENEAVTGDNRLHYIQLVTHYRLSKQIELQSQAFLKGLLGIIDIKWLR